MAAPARRVDSLFFPFFLPETRRKGPETGSLPLPVELPRPSLVPPPSPDIPGEREDVRQLRASFLGTAAVGLMNGSELTRALENRRREEIVPTTLQPFDDLLGGGLPRGRVVELTGRASVPRFSIVLAALASATSAGEAAALIDLGDHFDPQIGEANGIDLRRLLWIRPDTLKQAVMSLEMITATGFQLVAFDAGLPPVRGRRVPDAAWVRLARTADAHGGALIASTPYPLMHTAAEAVIVAHKTKAQWSGRGKSPRLLTAVTTELHLEKHRHMRPGAHATLTLKVLP